MAWNRNRKLEWPVRLNRGSSFARGLQYSQIVGAGKGFRSTDSGDPLNDSISGQRPVWRGVVGSGQYVRGAVGRGVQGLAVLNTALEYGAEQGAVNTNRNIQRGVSMMGVYTPTAGSVPTSVWLTRRPGQFGVHPGVSLGITAAPMAHHWTVCDGAGAQTVNSTTLLVVGVPLVVIGTYDGMSLKIFVNGVLEASAAGVIVPVNPPAAEGIKVDAINTFNADEGIVHVAAYWTRELALSEIARLSSDPFALYR